MLHQNAIEHLHGIEACFRLFVVGVETAAQDVHSPCMQRHAPTTQHETTCHRLDAIAHAGERGVHARNTNEPNQTTQVTLLSFFDSISSEFCMTDTENWPGFSYCV